MNSVFERTIFGQQVIYIDGERDICLERWERVSRKNSQPILTLFIINLTSPALATKKKKKNLKLVEIYIWLLQIINIELPQTSSIVKN